MSSLLTTIREFNRERDWEPFHTPKNLAMALLVEAAEIAEHFQWVDGEHSAVLEPSVLDEVRDEIGDVVIQLVNLADKLGIDPIAAAIGKIEKNRTKYPASMVRGKADKYTRYE